MGSFRCVPAVDDSGRNHPDMEKGAHLLRVFIVVMSVFSFLEVRAQICSKSQLPPALHGGLVGFYPFCGDANDASGLGNNGVAKGAVLTTDRFGNPNSAYFFDGVDDWVEVANSASLTLTGEMSMSAWVNTSGPNGQNYQTIVSKRQTYWTWEYAMALSYATGISHNTRMITSRALGMGNGQYVWSAGSYSPSKWELWTVVFSTGKVTIYRNGVLDNTASFNLTPNAQNCPLLIGRNSLADNSEQFFGKIDEVAIWNRAITPQEVSQLFQANCSIPNFNPLTDTTRVCGSPATLTAGSGFTSYSWSNGATTQSISPTASGRYKVTVTDSAGCQSSDSTHLILTRVDILQSDTTICRGASIELKSNASRSTGAMYVSGASPGEGGAVINNVGKILPTGNPKTYECTFVMESSVPSGTNTTIWAFGPEPLQSCRALGLRISSSQCGSNRLWLWGHNCPEFCGPVIVPNTIYHCVTVVNGNNVKVYLNGVLQMNVIMSLSGVLSDKFFIWSAWDNHIMKGSIDDIRVWDFPWTQSDVSNAYSDCRLPDPTKLISSWDFNQPTLAQVINTKTGLDDIDFKPKVSLSSTGLGACSPSSTGNFRWSTGETSETIVVKPLVTTRYFLTSLDVAGCADSVTVTVSDPGTFNPLPDTLLVCGTSAALDAGPGRSSYRWNTGSTTQSISPRASGRYRVTVTNSAGCESSDSTYLSLLKADIINRDTTICKGASIRLSLDSLSLGSTACVSSGLPSNLRNGLVGYWPFCGNANDASGNSNNGTVNGAVLTTDRFGNPSSAYSFDGVDDHITVPDNALLRPKQISISVWYYTDLPNASKCLLSKTQFPSSTNEQYFLDLTDFGIKLNSNCTPNNGWSYLRANGTAMFSTGRWVNLVCTWDGVTMRVYRDGVQLPGSLWGSSAGLTGSITDCIGGMLQFGRWWSVDPKWFNGKIDDIAIWDRALSVTEIAQINSSRPVVNWSNGAVGASTIVAPVQNTVYRVTVTDGTLSCTDSVTVRVASVDTAVTAQGATSICSTGDGVGLQAGAAAAYQWLRDGLAIAGATSRSHQASQTGDYRVALTSVEGCRDTSRAIRVTLNPGPIAAFDVDDSVKCAPDRRFTFVNKSTVASGSLSYTWDFGNGSTSQSPSPTVQYTRVGSYRVTLRATSDLGCVQSASRTLRIDSMPRAVRYDPVNALVNRPLTLDSRNIGVAWQWSPPNQLTGAASRRPVFQGDRDQQYLITIRNASGCATVDTLFVRAVKEYGIHVPGGFTPDNDGRNDRLYPITVGIREMRVFRVFNRWGELVFDNRNATPSTGWDGTLKGRPAPMETYAWIAEGVDLDGNVIRKSGNAILIR